MRYNWKVIYIAAHSCSCHIQRKSRNNHRIFVFSGLLRSAPIIVLLYPYLYAVQIVSVKLSIQLSFCAGSNQQPNEKCVQFSYIFVIIYFMLRVSKTAACSAKLCVYSLLRSESNNLQCACCVVSCLFCLFCWYKYFHV